jgi:hypothetical protein
VALLAAGIAAYLLVPQRAAPKPASAATLTAAPQGAVAVTMTATADCVSPPSQDAAGNAVEYGPDNMVDGRADSAWRCDGDGAGRSVQVTFDRPVRLTQVGLVPGYAKTDTTDGTDRYAQNRRIAEVRYRFDDGTAVDQPLDTAPTNRAAQTVAVPDVTTTGMTVTVVRSVPGNPEPGNEAVDKIAISELQVTARASG